MKLRLSVKEWIEIQHWVKEHNDLPVDKAERLLMEIEETRAERYKFEMAAQNWKAAHDSVKEERDHLAQQLIDQNPTLIQFVKQTHKRIQETIDRIKGRS